jgi:hypothetical protein
MPIGFGLKLMYAKDGYDTSGVTPDGSSIDPPGIELVDPPCATS